MHLPIAEGAYVWRYMNFKKLWNLLADNELYFARLDTFEDPLEGIDIDDRKQIELLALKRDGINPLFRDSFDRISVSSETYNRKRQLWFASCWFLTEAIDTGDSPHFESVAMWKYLSDTNTFVVKLSFSELLALFAKSAENYAGEDASSAWYGKVEYLNFFEQAFKRGNGQKFFVPLLKDKSFYFENELRLLLNCNDKKKAENRKGIKIPISEIQSFGLEVFAHPDIDDHLFEMFREKLATIGYRLQYSALITKKVAEKILRFT